MTDERKLRDYLRRVTIELAEERGRLHAYRHEPIAIVGMACRYPGRASSPSDLWQLVAEERDGIAGFPTNRGWDFDRLYHPDPEHPKTSYVRESGFLEDIASFDAEFFGISPREALAMDPQQRLLLESCWEALEDAGIDPASQRGAPVGVFAGLIHQIYSAGRGGSVTELDGYRATGNTSSIASGRIAYTLGLEGPAITVDTACSSSLVAMHLAMQALRGGECTLALTGGVTVFPDPSIFIEFSRQGGLAPDGRCKSFAEAADGTSWSEGVGMLVLERLSDAERNDHPVLALLKGSAVNQDGASNGLTAPNGPSQERVIRQALANAGLAPKDVDAVEAHGTGTTLGDPIEAGALLATYGQDRETPLKLGSIKSNIGHTQAAAGVAGVIKMTEAMRRGVLPRTLHVDAPSSNVDWEAGEIELLTEQTPWEGNGKPRRAGVSSFGISGTNAHVILEEGPGAEPAGQEATKPISGPVPLVLSAKAEPALADAAARLATHLQENPDLDPTDLAYSLATTRTAFEHRAVALGSDREELLASLRAPMLGRATNGKLALLFTGQGSQRLGMGKELYESDPLFGESFDRLCKELDFHLEQPLKETVFAEGKKAQALLDDTTYAQPALFAIEVALFEALSKRGLTPDLLTGHSIGEIAAAHVAGVLDLSDAARLVAARGALMGALPKGGAMAAIEASEQEVADSIEGREEELAIAAINGPNSTVISGTEEAVEEIRAKWDEAGRRTKELSVSHAFHSPLMEPMLGEFAEVAGSLSFDDPRIPIVSNLTGETLTSEQAKDPAYWVRHVREPVRFADAVATLQRQGTTTYLELGPDPVLCAMARECLGEEEQEKVALIPTLREGREEKEAVSAAIAGAHIAGAKLDWQRFFEGTGAKRVPLPTYPFQRKRFWLSSDAGTGDAGSIGQVAADHPLLGAAVELAGSEGESLLLTGRLSLSTHPWLADHTVGEAVLLPGTAFLELALRAAEQAGAETVEELTLQSPLVLPETGAVAIQVTVSGQGEDGGREIQVHSRLEVGEEESSEWTRHAEGVLSEEEPRIPEPLETWPPEGAEPIEVDYLYDLLAEHGLAYGPAFQGLAAAWREGERIYAEVALPEEQSQGAERYAIHPALLDAALHGIALGQVEGAGEMRLPFSWSGVSLIAQGARELRVSISPQGESVALGLADATGAPLGSVGALAMRPLDQAQLRAPARRQQGLLGIEWAEVSLPEESDTSTETETLRCELDADLPTAEATHKGAAQALSAIQAWLSDESKAEARLTLITKGAMATSEGESPDPAQGAIWGLLRSAQSEHPGRFALIDTDGTDASEEALQAALALGAEEPQLALREGVALAPRLARVGADDEASGEAPIDPSRNTLITGGTGGLGALFARHLAKRHQSPHLLLVSRSGEEAEGAKELAEELGGLGAEVRIAACDVSDPKALKALLASLPKEHPLGAVIHCAGVIDDATIESLTEEQLSSVLAPKVDAAQNLHELTKDKDLSAFVLFSSAAGTIGNPGQGNYAAANVFLDTLAQKRRAQGLPATSIAWGLWEREGMGSGLSEADIARMRRSGIETIADEQGIELFEAAIGSSRPLSVALPLNPAGLRAVASAGALPPILTGLVRTPKRRGPSGSLALKLASIPDAERESFVLDLVRGEVAAVLGHSSGAQIEPEKAFLDLGFDSLAAVELRNRIGSLSGARLAATAVFDYPTPKSLALHLLAEATASGAQKKLTLRAKASEEPIAIVGMACRYPGGVSSPAELWQLVAEGRDGISEFPRDRGWDLERLYDPDPESPGTSYTREGGFLHDAAEFDAEFFGVGPREALAMDPQQRLLLESCWEALEDAGIDPASLRGEQAGVFAGVMHHDYQTLGGIQSDDLGGYVGTGTSGSVASGRVSYAFGLEGPAMTIDTACSSSLVAMHLAAQALRGGECTLALAGGVTTVATPGAFVEFSRQRGLAPDGRCKSFAEAADGVAWSEGVGVLVLERLSEAKRNGHPILALLKGSAVNQDGASNGLTAPNGPSQERVIRQALANANLAPKDVDAVEGHGTGTALGDPIEAGALLATYGQERETPLRLGSIKSNIGHTQAAAGVAGVIKMTEAMRRGTLPKTLHVDAPSSNVDWEAGEIELLTEQISWEADGRPRRVGISSFGFSGTNAHVILEEGPAGETVEEPTEPLAGPIPLVLSAKTEPALIEAGERLATHLQENPNLDPVDLAYSLATSRTAFEHRAVALGSDREELLASLDAPMLGKATGGKLALLFTGQGSQRLGMGKELYESDPLFGESFDRVCEQLDRHLKTPLKETVFAKGKKAQALLDDTTYAQPALFAIEVALFEALSKRGLKPDYLAGHSIGEIAAAHVAGVLDLSDAARLVAARGALMGALPKGGAMAAIEASEQEVAESIGGKESELAIAAINGPSSTVISGTEEAVEEIRSHWDEAGRRTKELSVSHAFHSPLMEPMLEEFAEVAGSLAFDDPRIPIVSNLTGETLTSEQAKDPAYWVRHVREPVRFADAVATLAKQGTTAYLDLGPDPVLCAMARECLGDEEQEKVALIPTLREGREESEAVSAAIAGAFASGAKLDWQRFFEGTGAKRVPLPTYPFQRKRFWLSSDAGTGDAGSIGLTSADHPLLGAAVELAGGDGESLLLTGRLSLSTHPWLADHTVGDAVLLPGTAFLELALRAGEQAGAETVEELTLQSPLVLPQTGAVAIQVTVSGKGEDGGREIQVHSRPVLGEEESSEWTRHAEGVLSQEEPRTPEPLDTWPPEGAEPIEVDYLYDLLAEHGLAYGPAFQGLAAAWREGEEIYAEVALPEEQSQGAERYAIHPALLDAALHGIALGQVEGAGEMRLPFSWSGVSLLAQGARELRVSISPQGESVALGLADATGAPLGSVGALAMRPLDQAQLRAPAKKRQGLLGIEWTEIELGEEDTAPTEVETLRCEPDADLPTAEATHKGAAQALSAIQAWLKDESNSKARLTLITKGAMATSEGESPDPAQGAIWGLLRSAQSEHPGRFALIDTDGSEASEEALGAALSLGTDEPQLALREGVALAPRLARVGADDEASVEAPIDPSRSTLITGGTGGLGALFARHLAERHQSPHLLLLSRSGEEAEGAKELAEELGGLGAEVRIAACDVSDPKALKALLGSLPTEHPLGAVIHCAGVIDDATIESLTEEQLSSVFAPKVDAAQNLHEQSEDKDLSAFVLFSSAAGTIGNPGQGNYAAANVFLDTLAQKRRAQGLPATSIAWGLWQREGMGSGLSEADLARMRRGGIETIADERGIELFHSALESSRPLSVALPLNPAGLRAVASAGALPPILTGLVRTPKRRGPTGSLALKLASIPEAEREAHVLDLVRGEVAAVLGHSSAQQIEPEKAFLDLGFDSLAAVELRNRIGSLSGARLAATAVFDYPTPKSLARHLLAEATAGGAQRKLAIRAKASEEPIAILGMACRYPGGVSSPAELWQLVAEGRDGISEFPRDRGWDLERLYDPDPEKQGTSYTREGGFLAEPAEFDPEFFGVSPREALMMNPQERLLLESCWEALEDAGIDPVSLRQSATGVFAGVMYQDYGPAAGMTTSVVSGRIAYSFGLEGPAITVDTACSSSLVTMHLASQALRGGECSLALAGGVTVLSTPGVFVEFSRQRGLAPDGRSKSFADAADGVAWSEGVGMLVLERLSDAERNGHPILATIKGSAVNQDGASNGLTAPNGPSQERVIRQALANAGLAPRDVDAVEAHGTGTTLGDPIEAGALLATYGQDRETPLKLGSIKSNIGHTQAAAGVAGVIKMTEAMRRGTLPRTLHVDAPSSNVDWEAGEIELLTEQTPWEADGKPRRAGVSSFGISGTNAHVILEEGPGAEPAGQEATKPLAGPVPLVLSAKAEPALADAAERLASHIEANPDLDPADLAYSLATTRTAFEHRAVALGSGREELLASLRAPMLGRATDGKLALLFTGQGSQRLGMGKELYESDPLFGEAFDRICAELDSHLEQPLREIVFAKGKKAQALLDDTTYAQPALFAIEVALFEALSKRGLAPDYLTGHSIGEIAAAHVAGVFDLSDAARLVAARGALMGALSKGGAMAAIEASEEEIADSIEGRKEELAIAAINGPTSTVISGTEEAVEEIRSRWDAEGRRTKELTVSHAFHSPLMEPMLEEFAEVAGSLAFDDPQIPIVSNLTGETLTSEQAKDPAYWVRHAREPVRFADAVATLAKQGTTTYLELGADPVLCAMARECLGDEEQEKVALIPTLREGREEAEAICTALAGAHIAGAKLDWQRFFEGTGAKRVPLPTYPFQRKRFWLSSDAGWGDAGSIGLTSADHPLLEAAIELAGGDGESLLLTGRLSLSTHPWLADHVVGDAVLFPGTAFLELALRAAEQAGAETVEELTVQTPLILPEAGAVAIQVTVSGPAENGRRELAVHSRVEGGEDEGLAGVAEWTRHAVGALSADPVPALEPLGTWPPEGAEPIEVEYFYDLLAEHGAEYGSAFQGLTAAWLAGEEIHAELTLPEAQAEEAGRFGIHPALLDSGLHAVGLAKGGSAEIELPVSWQDVALRAAGASALRLRLAKRGDGYRVEAFDGTGAPVFSAGSVAMQPVQPAEVGTGQERRSLYGVRWRLVAAPSVDDLPEETIAIAAPQGQEAGDPADAALAAVTSTLASLQDWVAEERPAGSRLAFVTERAVAAADGESPDLAIAAVWGLVRSAISEHPGRFALVDTDGTEASEKALSAALALGAEEPQLALRDGNLLAPRLGRIEADEEAEPTRPIDPERTVLITGGLSGLGALVARHLAGQHGARHLLLVSRSGPEATGAAELRAELEELGAEVTIAACDVADRGALTKLFASVPDAHPLGAIVHSAGALADGVLASMDPERLERTMRPKATAAWHLHELSRDLDLSQFVMFSSAAGLLGGAAQANYAAANVFLDALAALRRAEGLPATSLAWGLWEQGSSLAGAQVDLASMERIANQIRERLGFAPMPSEQGLALFDAARELPEPLLAPVRFDAAILRNHARAGSLAPILRDLVRTPIRQAQQDRSLAQRLAELPESRREAAVLDLVRSQVAAVLGHASATDVEPGRALQELGFDSLAAVELRNRLSGATGVALPPTLVFDYPSAAAIASWLMTEVGDGAPAEGELREAEVRELLARLETTLSSLDPDDDVRERAGTRLRSLLVGLSDAAGDEGEESAENLASMSHEEMFELIDEEFGGGPSDGG